MKKFKLLSLVVLVSMAGQHACGMFSRLARVASNFTPRITPKKIAVGTASATLAGFRACQSEAESPKSIPASPEYMILDAKQALKDRRFKDVVQLRAAYGIQARLAAVCCKDPSVIAAMDILTLMAWDPKFSEIFQHVSDKEHLTILEQEIEKAEQDLANNKAPCPRWIARYGMNQFMPQQPTITDRLLGRDPLFLSNNQCRRKQKNVLQDYRKAAREALTQDAEKAQ